MISLVPFFISFLVAFFLPIGILYGKTIAIKRLNAFTLHRKDDILKEIAKLSESYYGYPGSPTI